MRESSCRGKLSVLATLKGIFFEKQVFGFGLGERVYQISGLYSFSFGERVRHKSTDINTSERMNHKSLDSTTVSIFKNL